MYQVTLHSNDAALKQAAIKLALTSMTNLQVECGQERVTIRATDRETVDQMKTDFVSNLCKIINGAARVSTGHIGELMAESFHDVCSMKGVH